MEDLLAMVQMAKDCVQAGCSDEALLHLGKLEAKLAKQRPVGKVDVVPLMGGSVGYLDVPVPLGTILYANTN